MTSETERAAADEDCDAQSDQDDGEEDVLPPFEDLGDGSTRGDELGGGHQHCHEHEENDAEGDDSGSTDVEEDRDVNADVCLLYTSPSPRDATLSRMPSSA